MWSYPDHENMIVVCLRLVHLGAGFSRQACCQLDKTNLTLTNEMVASAIPLHYICIFFDSSQLSRVQLLCIFLPVYERGGSLSFL